MAYTSTIATLRGEYVQVVIDGTYVGTGELTLAGDEPIIIDYTIDSIFKPLKMSGCSIKVVSSTPLLDLYTGDFNAISCKIYRGTLDDEGVFVSDELIWYGFLSPNVYTSGYKDVYDEFTLEFVDPLSVLENTKFKMFDDKFFATFKDYIDQALAAIGADDVITNYNISTNIKVDIEKVGCMQRNYIDETDDEDDGAMTWKEVMESIMQYLNMTACIYGDTLYIIDPLATGETAKSIADIGIAEGNGSIALGDVYNKVMVVANNNPIDSTIPGLLDDSNIVGNSIMADDADYLTTTYTSHKDDAEEYTKLNAFFNNSKYNFSKGYYIDAEGEMHFTSLVFSTGYTETISQTQLQGVEEGLYPTESKLMSGTFIQKFFEYKTDDGEPSSISWSTVLTMGEVSSLTHSADVYPMQHYYGGDDQTTDVYFQLSNSNWFIGKGGYFVLSMKYMFSNIRVFANSAPYAFTSETYGHALEYEDASTEATFRDDKFKVQLRVGNKYYNGSEWTEEASTFFITHKNKDGDKVFGTEKSIDNTVSYQWNLADSDDGFAIPLPDDDVMCGYVGLTLWADTRIGGMAQVPTAGCITAQDQGYNKYDGFVYNCSPILAIHISSLELKYTTRDTVEDIYNLTNYNADITYTNVCNEDNVKDAEDIDFTTNTYTSRAVSYSYAIQRDTDSDVYSYIESTYDDMNQEQQCIKRNVNYYSVPRLQYSNTLRDDKDNHLLPWSNVSIPLLDRLFTMGDISYNVANNSADVTLLEIPKT